MKDSMRFPRSGVFHCNVGDPLRNQLEIKNSTQREIMKVSSQ